MLPGSAVSVEVMAASMFRVINSEAHQVVDTGAFGGSMASRPALSMVIFSNRLNGLGISSVVRDMIGCAHLREIHAK